MFRYPIVRKSNLRCAYCSGCIKIPGTKSLDYGWNIGKWSECSTTAGQSFGQKTRSVACRAGLGGVILGDDNQCAGMLKPATTGSCSKGWFAAYVAGESSAVAAGGDRGLGYSSPAAAKSAQDAAIIAATNAGLTCDSDLRGNGDCDAECNNMAFNFDDGDCDPSGGCFKHTDCATCITDDKSSCGWCGPSGSAGSTGLCKEIPTGVNEPSSICNQLWFSDVCIIKEEPLELITPAGGSLLLEAGDSYAITWSGGKSGEKIIIKYEITSVDGAGISDGGKVFTGFGIPSEQVSNSGTYTWIVEGGITTSNMYKITIESSSDPTNTAKSATYFAVDGSLKTYKWQPGDFGTCSQSCSYGGSSGSMSRTVSCVQVLTSGGTKSAATSKCSAASKPSNVGVCGMQKCVYCPNVPACKPGGQWHPCPAPQCLKQGGSGPDEYCGAYINGFGCTGYDVNTNADSQRFACCIAKNLKCDNGCDGTFPSSHAKAGQPLAQWVLTSEGSCSKSCGGGLKRKSYRCKGQLWKHSTNVRNFYPILFDIIYTFDIPLTLVFVLNIVYFRVNYFRSCRATMPSVKLMPMILAVSTSAIHSHAHRSRGK